MVCRGKPEKYILLVDFRGNGLFPCHPRALFPTREADRRNLDDYKSPTSETTSNMVLIWPLIVATWHDCWKERSSPGFLGLQTGSF